jgi:transposase
VLRTELTIAEVSRELGIEQSVLRRWKHLAESGGQTAVAANEDVVPASELRAALQRIKELERALGKKTLEVEILRAAREEVKRRPHYYGVSKR